jgi:polyisoprenoid-binding protein YceI
MTRLALALALAMLSAAPIAAVAAEYRYDTVHSQILFSTDHNGYSRPFGRLHITGGWLRFDPDHWDDAATELDIDLTGVDMGNDEWDAAVRGRDFLDSGNAPRAHFASDSVTRTGERTGVLHGTLTLRGVSRPVAVAFTVNRIGSTLFGMHSVAGFSAHAVVDRYAFGMNDFPGSIGRQVQVRLEIEAIRDPQAQHAYEQSGVGDAAEE